METIAAESVLFPISVLVETLTCRERDMLVWKRLTLARSKEIYDSCIALVATCVAAGVATSLFDKPYLIEQMARLFCFSLDANRWITSGHVKEADEVNLLKTRAEFAYQLATRLGEIVHMIEDANERGYEQAEEGDDNHFAADSSALDDDENRDHWTSA
jgi:hypothetical protein